MENGHPVTKSELQAVLTAALSAQKAEIKDELTEVMRQIETNLLTEFHRYSKGQRYACIAWRRPTQT